jgi:hypothetical protein
MSVLITRGEEPRPRPDTSEHNESESFGDSVRSRPAWGRVTAVPAPSFPAASRSHSLSVQSPGAGTWRPRSSWTPTLDCEPLWHVDGCLPPRGRARDGDVTCRRVGHCWVAEPAERRDAEPGGDGLGCRDPSPRAVEAVALVDDSEVEVGSGAQEQVAQGVRSPPRCARESGGGGNGRSDGLRGRRRIVPALRPVDLERGAAAAAAADRGDAQRRSRDPEVVRRARADAGRSRRRPSRSGRRADREGVRVPIAPEVTRSSEHLRNAARALLRNRPLRDPA